MATVLDKQLKRQITVGGADYTVAVDPDGIRLTGKGRRRPEVELRWTDLLSGEAAMAVALNASLSNERPAPAVPVPAKPATAQPATAKPATVKPAPAKPPAAKPPAAKPPTVKPPTVKPPAAKAADRTEKTAAKKRAR